MRLHQASTSRTPHISRSRVPSSAADQVRGSFDRGASTTSSPPAHGRSRAESRAASASDSADTLAGQPQAAPFRGISTVTVAHSGKRLDIRNSPTADGAVLVQNRCYGRPAQRFTLNSFFVFVLARRQGAGRPVVSGPGRLSTMSP
ncbi:RICIN domain-containing protein [Streptomyces sp. NPDC051109]|uniref:RICIN domain-containing protein n=1 Tax=Streptomyces sp. NPDC051109 TaxID=3365642 RepID=UPI0037BC8D35